MNDTAQTNVEQRFSEPNSAPVLYNAHNEQRFAFKVENGQYRITFVFKGLTDDVLAEYDRLREVLVEAEGSKTDINTNSVDADNYFFRELCSDIEGYDGEKPDGWQDMVDYEEKKAAIQKVLGFKIIEDNSEKVVQKRQWGQKPVSNTVTIKARFDDQILVLKATFKDKLVGDTALYNSIKSRLSLIEKDMDESAIKIPASMKKKAKLFDKLDPRTEGYDGGVPMHHKAAFVTAFFEPSISSAEKK